MKQKFTITIADIEINIISEGSSADVEAVVNRVDRRIREICLKSPRISKTEAALLCALELCSERDALQKKAGENTEDVELLRAEYAKATAKIAELEAALAEKSAACESAMGSKEDFEILKEEYLSNKAKLDKAEAKIAAMTEKHEAALAAQKERYESAAAAQKEKADGRVAIMKEKYEAKIASLRARLDDAKKDEAKARQLTIDTDTAPTVVVTPVEDESEAADVPADESASGAAPLPTEGIKPKGSGKNSKVGSMFELLTFNDV